MEYTYNYIIRPRFSDIDSYDIAHHSKYFCWFEEARFYFLFNCINLEKELIATMKFPVTNIYCKYYKPVIYGNDYVIKAKVEYEIGNPIIKYSYKLVNENQKVLYAKGYSEHIALDQEGNYVMDISDEIKEKLLSIQKNN